jgi:hypothetical protein
MIGLGRPDEVQHAQQLAEETRRIINAAITTIRSNLKSQRPPNLTS